MKLKLPTKQLLASLANLKAIAKPSTTHAILSNVRFTANKDTVELLGMDLEKQLAVTLPCKVTRKGTTTISCQRLHDSLAKAKGDECEISTDEKQQSTIKVGGAVVRLAGLPSEEMPQVIGLAEAVSVTIPAAQLNDLLSKSLVHASTDKSRAMFCSVILLSKGGTLYIQATNGNRLITCDTGIAFKSPRQFIIPRESVPSFVALASTGDVELLLGENALSAKTESCEFSTKIIEGSLPDFEKVYPPKDERKHKITANREELIELLEFAEVLTSDLTRAVVVSCDGKRVTAKANAGDVGSSENSIAAQDGSATIEFAINPAFLRDSLKCLTGETATLEMVDAFTAIVLAEDGITCAVCPLRIKTNEEAK